MASSNRIELQNLLSPLNNLDANQIRQKNLLLTQSPENIELIIDDVDSLVLQEAALTPPTNKHSSLLFKLLRHTHTTFDKILKKLPLNILAQALQLSDIDGLVIFYYLKKQTDKAKLKSGLMELVKILETTDLLAKNIVSNLNGWHSVLLTLLNDSILNPVGVNIINTVPDASALKKALLLTNKYNQNCFNFFLTSNDETSQLIQQKIYDTLSPEEINKQLLKSYGGVKLNILFHLADDYFAEKFKMFAKIATPETINNLLSTTPAYDESNANYNKNLLMIVIEKLDHEALQILLKKASRDAIKNSLCSWEYRFGKPNERQHPEQEKNFRYAIKMALQQKDSKKFTTLLSVIGKDILTGDYFLNRISSGERSLPTEDVEKIYYALPYLPQLKKSHPLNAMHLSFFLRNEELTKENPEKLIKDNPEIFYNFIKSCLPLHSPHNITNHSLWLELINNGIKCLNTLPQDNEIKSVIQRLNFLEGMIYFSKTNPLPNNLKKMQEKFLLVGTDTLLDWEANLHLGDVIMDLSQNSKDDLEKLHLLDKAISHYRASTLQKHSHEEKLDSSVKENLDSNPIIMLNSLIHFDSEKAINHDELDEKSYETKTLNIQIEIAKLSKTKLYAAVDTLRASMLKPFEKSRWDFLHNECLFFRLPIKQNNAECAQSCRDYYDMMELKLQKQDWQGAYNILQNALNDKSIHTKLGLPFHLLVLDICKMLETHTIAQENITKLTK